MKADSLSIVLLNTYGYSMRLLFVQHCGLLFNDMNVLLVVFIWIRLRQSTHERVKLLASDRYRLSDVMRDSLATDRLAPVIIEEHLEALDRRLSIIIEQLTRCVTRIGSEEEVFKPEPRIEDYKEKEAMQPYGSDLDDDDFDF